ncbi:lipopolysaccharide biosynthesis protein [uncultured Bacteroides sp.]|uniref:lipopolysaccharide biosynthesis protein n=1 Tax=uncultured Bacteroides sp. TaxID=162156 RepID=UPI002AA68FE3|nr:lipopolysaccharide biosynthesis protein [uncultured Bacteroides sp.]
MSKVKNGLFWSSIDRFSSQGVGFILSILIARIVSPSSYGLIVMIQVFLSLSQVFIDGGFANALIQKKDRNEKDYSTAFIFNLIVAILLYFILFLSAPFIADFYNKPQLVLLTRVISLNLIIQSVSIIQRAKLQAELEFKPQAKVSLLSVTISGCVGVACAYYGLEVWALVIQSISMQFFTSLSYFYFVRWIPKMTFSKESFKKLFGFGSKLMLSNLLTGIYLNIYVLVIGKKYSSSNLAYYDRAFAMSQITSVNIENVLYKVFYPALCDIQDNKDMLVKNYYRYLSYTNYIILPFIAIIIALANPLVTSLLTDKWHDSIPMMRIFCINFAIYAWLEQSGSLINVIGKPGLNLKAQIVKRILSIVILVITLPFGLTAICWGITLSTLLELFINLYLDKITLDIGCYEHVCSQAKVFLLNIVTCGITYTISQFFDNLYIQLLVGGGAGLLFYVLLSFLFHFEERTIWINIYNYFFEKIKNIRLF